MKDKKGSRIKQLTNKYRFVILNEVTFEEKVAFKLSRLNVFFIVGSSILLLLALSFMLISYTPLREYVPGYASTKLKKQAIALVYKSDSLENVISRNGLYIKNVQELLTGKISNDAFDRDSILQDIKVNTDSIDFDPSEEDLKFREEIEQTDRYSIFNEAVKMENALFFSPVKGMITEKYNQQNKHFAIDIALKEGSPIKTIADGSVIYAGWTAGTGHIMVIQHIQGFISVYKHNSVLLKKQGDLVKSGEVIASSGNTGELTTGPHLHFELWNNGFPVDPMSYIDFE